MDLDLLTSAKAIMAPAGHISCKSASHQKTEEPWLVPDLYGSTRVGSRP